MPKREMRVVQYVGDAAYLAVCTNCNQQFKVASVATMTPEASMAHLLDRFALHECKPMDESQAAARIVREATEKE
jgi:hypothetical protein